MSELDAWSSKPQLVGTRLHVPTLKTKVWQFSLNIILYFTLGNTLNFCGLSGNYQLPVVLLYAAMFSTLLLHNKCCKRFQHTNRLKSFLLTSLFLIKLAFSSYLLYKLIFFADYHIPHHLSAISQTLITICMDAFFVYIFGKSALNTYSLSSIWNLNPTVISKPLFCAGLSLGSIQIMWLLSNIISGFVYGTVNVKDVNI